METRLLETNSGLPSCYALTAARLAGLSPSRGSRSAKYAKNGTSPILRIGISVRFCPKAVTDWLPALNVRKSRSCG
jgi:hypothetical protein